MMTYTLVCASPTLSGMDFYPQKVFTGCLTSSLPGYPAFVFAKDASEERKGTTISGDCWPHSPLPEPSQSLWFHKAVTSLTRAQFRILLLAPHPISPGASQWLPSQAGRMLRPSFSIMLIPKGSGTEHRIKSYRGRVWHLELVFLER